MFKCYLTGKCCYKRDGYETIVLPDEAYSFSKEFGLNLGDFFNQFCNVVTYEWSSGLKARFSVLKNKKKACIFLKEKKCAVHDSKPFVCKAGPIIPPLFNGCDFDSWFKLNCRGAIEADNKSLALVYITHKRELEQKFNEYYEEYFKKEPSIIWIKLIKSQSITT